MIGRVLVRGFFPHLIKAGDFNYFKVRLQKTASPWEILIFTRHLLILMKSSLDKILHCIKFIAQLAVEWCIIILIYKTEMQSHSESITGNTVRSHVYDRVRFKWKYLCEYNVEWKFSNKNTKKYFSYWFLLFHNRLCCQFVLADYFQLFTSCASRW